MSPRAPSLLVALTVAALLGAGVRVRAASPDEGPVVALVGGELRPVSGPVIANGTVLVRDGRLLAVGADVDVPAGARVIDCSGKVVTPGLIDADSALALDGDAANGRLPGADVFAADAFDAHDARLRTALRQGVTMLHLGANRAQSVGGVTSVVPAGPAGAAPLVRDGALVVNVSTAGAASGLPAAGRIAGIRSILIAAEHRDGELERWRRELAEYEEERLADVPLPEERLLLPPELLERMRLWAPKERVAWREAAFKSMGREKAYTKPKKVADPPRGQRDDPNMETIASILGAGRRDARRVLMRAELDAEVGAALEMVEEFDLDAVVAGGEGLRDRADDLVKARVAVVLTHLGETSIPVASPLARRGPGLGAALAAAGLRPALASGDAAPARFLRLLAAREAGEGMSRADALAAVTLWAAEAAGVAADTGSLEPGKRADVVVWDGDPLAAATRAAHVLVGGVEVDLARD